MFGYRSPQAKNASYATGREEFPFDAFAKVVPDRFMKNSAALLVEVRIFMAEDERSTFFRDREDPREEGHIVLPDLQPFSQRFHYAPPGKLIQSVAEHEEVCKFAGKCGTLEMGVEQAVHAHCGYSVQIWSVCGLQGCPAVEVGMAAVTETIEKKKDAAHERPPGKGSDTVTVI
jgi:hypothetical protein